MKLKNGIPIGTALLPLLVVFLSCAGTDNRWEIIIEHQRGYLMSEFIYDLENRPTPECHASTVVETGRGILVAWFGGTEEGHSDVGIWTARKADLEPWTEPVQVADGIVDENTRYPCWNPVLFRQQDGPLLLFYKVGPNPREWWGMVITSEDDGFIWSEPVRLPDGILGPIKNKPITLPDGRILCGSSKEDEGWQVFFEITEDPLGEWKSIGPVNNPDRFAAIQPTLLCFPKDGTVHALCRTRQGVIGEVVSEDQGKSWSRMKRTKLLNPNSGIDGVSLNDKRHLLVYNRSDSARTPLNVAITKYGKRWKPILRLEDEKGEYSYPAIIQSSDGLIHITYTWNRETIKYILLDPSRL